MSSSTSTTTSTSVSRTISSINGSRVCMRYDPIAMRKAASSATSSSSNRSTLHHSTAAAAAQRHQLSILKRRNASCSVNTLHHDTLLSSSSSSSHIYNSNSSNGNGNNRVERAVKAMAQMQSFWGSFSPMSVQLVQVTTDMLLDICSTASYPPQHTPFTTSSVQSGPCACSRCSEPSLEPSCLLESSSGLGSGSPPASPLMDSQDADITAGTRKDEESSFSFSDNSNNSRLPSPPLTPPTDKPTFSSSTSTTSPSSHQSPSMTCRSVIEATSSSSTDESLRRAIFLAAHASRFPYPYRSDAAIPTYRPHNASSPSSSNPISHIPPSPHLLFHALYYAHRISRSPLASQRPDLFAKPHTLLLAGVLLAEAHLADVQTSTAVWCKLTGLIERRDVANLKMMALHAVEFESAIGVECYMGWLGHVRGFIQERYGGMPQC
ncbi:hypothetical protein HDU97_008993 [Phlyctochytrium planicorne]|nr:hypothetical protein HDU97_008993 [Phlyctochytrium planicorne]